MAKVECPSFNHLPFDVKNVPFPFEIREQNANGDILRRELKQAWKKGAEDLAEYSKTPSGSAIWDELAWGESVLKVKTASVGKLVGMNNTDRIRKIRSALGVGVDIPNNMCQVTRQELLQLMIGIFSRRNAQHEKAIQIVKQNNPNFSK